MPNPYPLDFKKYADRRKFTDEAHRLWMHHIYQLFSWTPVSLEDEYQNFINDVKHGQDYFVKNPSGQILSIQERNRTGKRALDYNDITIRYTYPEYTDDHFESEWFKLDADILIYTVIGHEPTYLTELKDWGSYDKIAIIDLRRFEYYIQNRFVQIVPDLQSNTSVFSTKTQSKVLLSPLRHNQKNPDDSPSDFIVFDVQHLYELDPSLIGYDKGFGTPKDINLY